jgi:hypothetical protein
LFEKSAFGKIELKNRVVMALSERTLGLRWLLKGFDIPSRIAEHTIARFFLVE